MYENKKNLADSSQFKQSLIKIHLTQFFNKYYFNLYIYIYYILFN